LVSLSLLASFGCFDALGESVCKLNIVIKISFQLKVFFRNNILSSSVYIVVFIINILTGRSIGFIVQVRLIKNNNIVIFFSHLNIFRESIGGYRMKRNIF
jgi:hypothetical protein